MEKVAEFLELVDIFQRKYSHPEKIDIIVILGAGASFCSGMPPWKNVNKEIFEEAIGCYKNPDDFIDNAWEKIRLIYGEKANAERRKERKDKILACSSVETICNIACESDVVGKKIRELFIKKYGYPKNSAGPHPQLAYEIIAHFMKHKIINHAITFNFDEVLTQSLKNEVGPDSFEEIFSDQQVLMDQVVEKQRLIKIHGSISHPQTMKFTRDNTREISQSLINLLDNTFSIAGGGENSRRNEKELHIISLGYSWNDRDFVSYILSRQNYIKSISVVKLDCEQPKLLAEINKKNTKVNVISTEKMIVYEENDIDNQYAISIDQVLWALWNNLEKYFDKIKLPYVLMNRHLILGVIFGPKIEHSVGLIKKDFPDAPTFINEHEIEKRFYVEVMLHLIKCKGMVNASNMALDPRLDFYYRLIKQKKGRKKFKSLNCFEELIQSKFADVKETYFAKEKKIDDLISAFIDSDYLDKIKNVSIPEYKESEDKIVLKQQSYEEFIRKQLEKVYVSPEVEIISGIDKRAYWVFNGPESLDDYREFQEKTKRLIENNWTHLFAIAETGAWLFNNPFFDILENYGKDYEMVNGKRKIYTINASDYGTEEWYLRREIKKDIREKENGLKKINYGITQFEIPWWEHNRHLTLAYDSSQKKFLGGIYFRRTLKTSRIKPVSIRIQNDCIELFFTFLSYIRRVYQDTYNKKNKRRRSTKEFKELKKEIIKIKNEIENNCSPDIRERFNKIINEICY